jgi:hypothetical protein
MEKSDVTEVRLVTILADLQFLRNFLVDWRAHDKDRLDRIEEELRKIRTTTAGRPGWDSQVDLWEDSKQRQAMADEIKRRYVLWGPTCAPRYPHPPKGHENCDRCNQREGPGPITKGPGT